MCISTALFSCNPLVGTTDTDSGFHPGVSVSSSPTPVPITFPNQTDDASNQFAGGSSTGTAWDGTNHYVRLNQGGTPTNHSELDSSWTPEWSSLASYWKFNETSGTTIADSSSIGTNTGVVSGAVTLGAPGKLNRAASFTGAAAAITLTTIPTSGTQSCTSSAWIKTTSTGSRKSILAYGNDGAQGQAQYLFINSSNVIEYDLVNIAGPQSGTVVTDGNWHQVMAVNTSGSVQIYIDGQPSGSSAVMNPNITSGAATIGTDLNNDIFNGSIDEVAVWSAALSAPEIQTIYDRQSVKFAGTFTSRVMDGLSTAANWTNFSWIPTLPFFKELPDAGLSEAEANYSSQTSGLMNGLAGLWHLDETSGATTIIDASGNGNNGTPNNTVSGAIGKLGTAASFNGSSSYIQLNSNITVASQSVTFSAWVYPANLSNSPVIFYNQGSQAYNVTNGFYIELGIGIIGFNNAGTGCQSTSGIPLNAWSQVTVVITPSIVNFYVNGTPAGLAGTCPVPISQNIQALSYLGTNAPGAYFTLDGSMDEVAIWSRALSSSEVLELYRRGANRIKYQVRTCTSSTCSDDPTGAHWKGPDNSNQSYFSELNNNAVQSDGGDLTSNDSVQASLPNMLFSNFMSLFIPSHQYFQYRAIMESDDTSTNCNYGAGPTWCSPELKSVTAGPIHQQ